MLVAVNGALGEGLGQLLHANGFGVSIIDPTLAGPAIALVRPTAVIIDAALPPPFLVACAHAASSLTRPARVVLLQTGEVETPPEVPPAAEVVTLWTEPEELMRLLRGGSLAQRPRTRPPAPIRATGRDPLRGLTERERSVLSRLMAGQSGEAIAHGLGISPNTVRTHVQNILNKLNAATRLEAVSIGYRAGLTPMGRFATDVEAAS